MGALPHDSSLPPCCPVSLPPIPIPLSLHPSLFTKLPTCLGGSNMLLWWAWKGSSLPTDTAAMHYHANILCHISSYFPSYCPTSLASPSQFPFLIWITSSKLLLKTKIFTNRCLNLLNLTLFSPDFPLSDSHQLYLRPGFLCSPILSIHCTIRPLGRNCMTSAIVHHT